EAFLDQLGQTELENRHLALLQAGDPLGVDIGTDDVMTEVREARGSGEPDVSRPDDRDSHRTPRPRPDMRTKSRGRRAASADQQPTGGEDADAPAEAERLDDRA